MKEVAINVKNISKKYLIGNTTSGKLQETLMGFLKGKSRNSLEDFWALSDINFEVNSGEAIGIIGKNGAGKSTLLKILSRITEPTSGRIEINGRVSSLLEVGTGFHPELTGRENVFLNGTILGMSRAEVKLKFDEIIEFSGVEKFLDTPVKRYSSGMKVRLAFAVAAHLEPEILIIDEVLAVGDAEFQKKCIGKMQDVSGQGRTVLFVSHNMGAVKNLCSRSILLEDGSMKAIGKTKEIVELYFNNMRSIDSVEDLDNRIRNLPTDPIFELISFTISQNGVFTTTVTNDMPIKVGFLYSVKQRTKGLRVYFDLEDLDGNIIIRSFHDENAKAIPYTDQGTYYSEATIPSHLLAPTKYVLIARATIFNIRSCTGPNGLKLDLNIVSNNNVNAGYNDTLRAKILPRINWESKKNKHK